MFTFTPPRYVESIGLLDMESDGKCPRHLSHRHSAALIVVYSSGNTMNTYINSSGGNNSFENMSIATEDVEAIEITFNGSGAITDIWGCPPGLAAP